MKMMLKSTLFLAVAALLACGPQRSNPLKGYEEIDAKAFRAKQEKRDNQSRMTRSYTCDIEGGDPSARSVNFMEGEPGSFKIRVAPQEPGNVEEWSVAVESGPHGGDLQKLSKEIYEYKWAPAVGDSAQGTATLAIKVETTKAPQSRFLELAGCNDNSFTINIGKTNKKPTLKVSNLPKDITEGDVVSFNVEVFDPLLIQTQPKLTAPRYIVPPNLETVRYAGSEFVQDSIETAKPSDHKVGRWTYKVKFDTRNRSVPSALTSDGQIDVKADKVNVCFNIAAENAGGVSDPSPHCVNIHYKISPPVVTSPSKVIAGTMNPIHILVNNTNGRGEIEVENITPDFDQWPGNPIQFGDENGKCTKMSKTSMICTMNWNTPCDMGNKYFLKLKLTSRFNDKAPSKEVTLGFDVIKTNPKCEFPEAITGKGSRKAPPKPVTSPSPAPTPETSPITPSPVANPTGGQR